MLFHFLVVLLSTATTLDAYSSGAPASACVTLAPKHPGAAAQSSPLIYSIVAQTPSVAQGSTLIVSVTSPQRSPFQGFVMQARNPLAPNEPLGVFVSVPVNAQTVDCPPSTQNTVTHTNKSEKTNVDFEWQAPADYIGTVVFKGTVLQDYSTYWPGVTSDAVQVVKRSLTDNSGQSAGISTTRRPKTTPPPTLRPDQPVQQGVQKNAMFIGCGEGTKSCYAIPTGCMDTDTCKLMSTIDHTATEYVFELLSKVNSLGSYIAIGLSDDTKMGADSVVQCVDVGDRVILATSWNIDGATSNQVVENYGVELKYSNVTNGNIYCQFTRPPHTTHNGRTYDLDKTPYYLMLATGPAKTDSGSPGGSVGYHTLKEVGGEPLQLSVGGSVGSKSKLLLRLHAAFMIAAWIGFASIGILLARYFKQTWVGNQLCGKDQWFAWHRMTMLLTWSLTIAAFILIFVELKAWSSANNPHAILGTVTTILAFIQPFMAALRPDPTSDRRPIFNWCHWLVGNAAHILAIVTIFFATKLTKAEVPVWLDWIIVSYVAFHVLMHLTLSIIGCSSEKTSSKRVSNFPMKDMGSSRNPLQTQVPRSLDAPHSALRKSLLGVYIVVIILLTVAIVVIAVMAPIENSYQKIVKMFGGQ